MHKLTNIYQLNKIIKEHNSDCVVAGKENGVYRKYGAEEYAQITNELAYGLLNLGMKHQDKIALISPNRVEWAFVDMAIAKMGGINTPVYPNITSEDYEYILRDSEARIAFAGTEEIYKKIKDLPGKVETLEAIYSFDQIEGVPHWTEVRQKGADDPKPSIVKDTQTKIKGDDLYTLIYTSGTTGNPKGVMLSHRNLLSQLEVLQETFVFDKGDKSLSFLPLCHIFERTLTYYYLLKGVGIYYAESIETIGDNLKEVNPQAMATVPRLLEKVYDKIVAKGGELGGVKKMLFFWALNLGLKHELDGKNGWWYEFQLKLANKIIFNKWREALGGNMRYIFSGAAALQPRLARIFTAAQIPVYEGYGLTETSPVIAVNVPGQGGKYYGTVGPVISGCDVRFAEDGEILVKGDNVMKGYLNQPEKTDEVLQDGWFSTGDIGELVENKYLKITDRKKEIFKTSGGKYVAPQVMENKFKESIFIEQVMVIGEGEKHPSALIVPNFVTLVEWCRRHHIGYTSDSEMIRDHRIVEKMQSVVNDVNSNFANYEQVKKFELMPTVWSVDTGELTATMKLRRKPIMNKYKEVIEKIYAPV